MSDEEMQALRAAAEKATPGPWCVETDIDGDYIQIAAFDDTGNRALCIRAQSFRVADDAAFIALANPAAVLALLDRVAAAERVAQAAERAASDAAALVETVTAQRAAREAAAWRAGRDAAAAVALTQEEDSEDGHSWAAWPDGFEIADAIRALQPPADLAAAATVDAVAQARREEREALLLQAEGWLSSARTFAAAIRARGRAGA